MVYIFYKLFCIVVSSDNNSNNNCTKKKLTVRPNLIEELNVSKISNLYKSKQTIMVSLNLK